MIPCNFTQLEKLSFRQNCFGQCNSVSLKQEWNIRFPKLKYLDISKSPSIGTLHIHLEGFPSSVTYLIAENVSLSGLENKNFNNIILLKLNHNQNFIYFGNYLLDNFPKLKSLQYLYISGCKIESIAENYFEAIEAKLITLDISNNNIEWINNRTFLYLSQSLSILNLSSNPLRTMFNLGTLENLTELYLNNMYELNGYDFEARFEFVATIKSLKVLHLKDNRLKTLTHEFFEKFPHLDELDLSHNFLRSLPSGESLNSLHRLILFDNDVSNLDDLSIYEIQSLELLNIKNNSVANLYMGSWKNPPKNLTIVI